MARKKLRYRLKKQDGETGIFISDSMLDVLAGATDTEIKLLIFLAKEGRDKFISENSLWDFAKDREIDREAFVEALAFFRGAGFVESEEKTDTPLLPEKQKEVTLPVPTRRTAPRPTYTSVELAKAASEKEFLELVDFAGRSFKKTLNTNDVSLLYSFVDSLCLPYDVIMLGIEHCVTEGKTSLGYVDKLLRDFAEREINTYERAEDYIRARVLFKGFEGKIRTLMGLGQRSLTSREKAILTQWQSEWNISFDLITLAYERTIEKTGKASMSYMNKILENWHSAGFQTVDEVVSGDKKPEESSSTFDLDEFFQKAVTSTRNKKREE